MTPEFGEVIVSDGPLTAEELARCRDLDPITLQWKYRSSYVITGNRTYFRSIERFLSDGRRDTQRSRYWINGRLVRHSKFQRLLRSSE